MIVVGDTSGLIAALNTAEPDHARARTAMSQAALTVVSPLVMAEIEHIVTRVDRRAAYRTNDWLLDQERVGRIAVAAPAADDLRRARGVQRLYAGLDLDLADALNVVLAERYETEVILTLDRRYFRTIVPLTPGSAFRLLPDDQ